MNDMTVPTSQQLAREADGILVSARAFKIATSADYLEAGNRLQLVKGLDKRIGEFFDPHIRRAHEAHKALTTDKAKARAPLVDAEAVYKRAIRDYDEEQERIRRAQQAKAEEAARKERQRLEARARKAAEQGKAEKAAELETRAQTVATPVIASSTPRLDGISTRSTWKAEVTSKALLIEAAAGGRRLQPGTRYVGPERRRNPGVPLTAVLPNDAFIGQQARSLKSELQYPGVRAYEDKSVSSRSS